MNLENYCGNTAVADCLDLNIYFFFILRLVILEATFRLMEA